MTMRITRSAALFVITVCIWNLQNQTNVSMLGVQITTLADALV